MRVEDLNVNQLGIVVVEIVYARLFGKEFVTDGYRQEKDSFSGKRTRIGAHVEGFRSRSGAPGAPANGSDFPIAVRRSLWASRQSIVSLQGANLSAVQEQKHLVVPDGSDPSLAKLAYNARRVLPRLSWSAIGRIRLMRPAGFGAEADVRLDPTQGAVYKIVTVDELATRKEKTLRLRYIG